MNRPVDVLTTLDLFISAYVDGQIPESDQVAIRKARAAVAELIEAAAEMNCLAKGPTGGVSVSDKRAVIARMDAALSSIGSTK